MEPIIAIYDIKDMIISILSAVIILKLLLIVAYYRWVQDTRNTVNGFVKSDIASFKKFQ